MAEWTDKENALLKELYPNYTINELIPHFNHTKHAIYQQALHFGLRKSPEGLQKSFKAERHGRPWKIDEIKQLEELCSQGLSIKEIGNRLGRGPYSVKGMMQRLRLKITFPPPQPTLPEALEKAKKMSWQYLAGIIDGEGSLVIALTRSGRRREKRLSPWLLIANTNTLLMESIPSFFYAQLDSYKYHRYKPTVYDSPRKRKANEKPVYSILIAQKDLLKTILLHVQSYLIVKERQAKIMLDFLETTNKEPALRLKLRQEMCSLNKRGRVSG